MIKSGPSPKTLLLYSSFTPLSEGCSVFLFPIFKLIHYSDLSRKIAAKTEFPAACLFKKCLCSAALFAIFTP
jgi:hypothetical protein